jgi:WD40 repeat protein
VNGDIELEIGAGSGVGNYAVQVIRSAAGGEPEGALELNVEELLSRRDVLEATVLASAVPRRSVSVNEEPVREVGRQLFQALFTGPVNGTYRASLAVAQQRGKRLRLVLRLTAPELAALPWEMLFDPETETYVCRKEPLVRHVHAPYTADPLEVRPPLRILGLVASPQGLTALDVEAEKDHLAKALAAPIAKGLVKLVWVPEATWDGVHARLLADEWHVLHFVGHGDYDTGTDEGVLALVGQDGRADMVEAGRLADLLDEAQPTPRLVVLNSCSSGQAGANDLFSGTAAALVRSGISAVAAMQFTVSDTAAIAFARGFYTAIAHGRSVDEAARSGRISILGAPRSLEWVTPVLYVRGQAAQLFTLTPSRAGDRESPPGPQAIERDQSSAAAQATELARRRQAELSALYVAARAELRLRHFDAAIGLFDDLLILDPGYPDAAGLRDIARRGRQLADTYTRATAAEDTGDWIAAAHGYDEVLRIDPAYQDAAARKEACQARQQVADLQAELRQHASAGQWQAVLDVDAELTRLDPSSSDPDGLTTRVRDALTAEQRTADLERRYAQARNAEDHGDWATAARGYDEVLQIDPAYQDAAARRDLCRQVARLQSELEEHAAAGHWPQVLATIKKLTQLDPAAAQPPCTELAARARRELATHPPEPQWRINCGRAANAVSWHPDGRRIAVATESARARVYDVSGKEPKELLTVKAAREPVTYKVAIPRKSRAMTWLFGPGNSTTSVTSEISVDDVAFSPDGTRLATASLHSAWIWDAASGQQQVEIRHDNTVKAVAFSPDGTRLATASRDGSARVWDAASGQQQVEIRHDNTVKAVAFSPDGTRLATASLDSAQVWDAASGQQLLEIRHDTAVKAGAFRDTMEAVAFSPDGTRLATASRDGSARVWDAAGGQQLLKIRHDNIVWAVAFSPDGTRLGTASWHSARVWDAAGGQQLTEIRHDNRVTAVAFSPDCTRLATGSQDKSLRIWPVAGL